MPTKGIVGLHPSFLSAPDQDVTVCCYICFHHDVLPFTDTSKGQTSGVYLTLDFEKTKLNKPLLMNILRQIFCCSDGKLATAALFLRSNKLLSGIEGSA